MGSDKLFKVTEEWEKQSLVNKEQYENLYEESIKNNESFLASCSFHSKTSPPAMESIEPASEKSIIQANIYQNYSIKNQKRHEFIVPPIFSRIFSPLPQKWLDISVTVKKFHRIYI